MRKDCESIIKEIEKLTNKIEIIDKKINLIMQISMPPPEICSTSTWINNLRQSITQFNINNTGVTYYEKF